MNFAQTDGTNYSISCINNSSVAWTFYIYQKMPNQPSDIFSLAWFASPYKIAPGAQIKFLWTIDYSFMWAQSGTLMPGVLFAANQYKDCNLDGVNMTTFSMDNNTPNISNPIKGGQAGSLTINEAGNIPNNAFSTGIAMSGQGTFAQQALANTKQIYTPEPEYYVAAGNQVQMGVVLAQTITNTAKFKFGSSIYSLKATLDDANEWSIS